MASLPPNAYSMYHHPHNQATPMAIGHSSSGRSAHGGAALGPASAYSVSPSPSSLAAQLHSSGPFSVKPRRTVSNTGGRRRAGTGTGTGSKQRQSDDNTLSVSASSTRAMSPATLTSHNLHKMSLSSAGAGQDDDGADDDAMDADGDDSASTGSTPAPGGARKSRSKKEKGQTFQCEKCSKVYRHPQCLIKHRWEHTQYWKEASKLMLSKHQQVQMLEAAAILYAPPQSLPIEKALWPAAVSPPSSGLHGSERLNIDVIRRSGTPGPSSSLSTSQPGSWTRSMSQDFEPRDDDDEDEYGSPETDPDPEVEGDESMQFKMDDLEDGGSGGSGSDERDSGYASGSVRSAGSKSNGSRAAFGQGPVGKLGLAVSAPVMGFFDDHQPTYNTYGQYNRGRR